MRALTAEEKTNSTQARNQVNYELSRRRKKIGAEIRSLALTNPKRKSLLLQFDSLRDIKGLPVMLLINHMKIVIDYEILQKFLRKLKNRNLIINIKVDVSSDRFVLVIKHYVKSGGKDQGSIELYELPFYQRELLKDLPIVEY